MTDTETRPPMPPAVAAAVCAVMENVPKLQKGEKNTHGNYDFASIDDFLEAVRPLCAEHGLIIMQDEESVDVLETADRSGKPIKWLKITFRFTLAHKSGETWDWYPRRTAMANASMGSQAFGAAQSYALKQYLRAALMIATGETSADLDANAPENLPEVKLADWKSFGYTKTRAAEELRALGSKIRSDDETPDEQTLDAHLVDHANLIEAVMQCSDWWDGVEEQIQKRRDVLRQKVDNPV